MTNEAVSVLKRQIAALEETSTEEQELPGSNIVTMQNQEIQVMNKGKQTKTDLDVADITPSTVDKNPSKSTATHTGSENRLNDENSPPI